ncbi:hypothetical protein [Anaerostipes sp.]|jgi:hypothetical protein|uniref:Uncharacterized protein n=1 Tax=Myoviridae sp. ctzwE5 TaxID=2825214 RepID=A0A8S5PX69_9CAUD|nr:hypothetical protein [Anaerostipes sp.]MED9814693.1 hypothetical protein [Anaerostipes sp.]DAE11107.1 MAG TPA: hypothetical protein [Myoviridae sp. ctzwE5]
MVYEVVKAFHDLQDYKDIKGGKVYHHYDVGDTYPRQGLSPDEARIEELSGSANAQGTPLIVEAKEKVDAEKA